MRRSAMMQADSETVAEETAGKSNPGTPCMQQATLVIDRIRTDEDMRLQMSHSRKPLRTRTTDPG